MEEDTKQNTINVITAASQAIRFNSKANNGARKTKKFLTQWLGLMALKTKLIFKIVPIDYHFLITKYLKKNFEKSSIYDLC